MHFYLFKSPVPLQRKILQKILNLNFYTINPALYKASCKVILKFVFIFYNVLSNTCIWKLTIYLWCSLKYSEVSL